ncbi:MAG: hypothetical protein GX488_06775 [Clostridiales bacterium]|nr:hypothetical protein [Clostridiales bacterium]
MRNYESVQRPAKKTGLENAVRRAIVDFGIPPYIRGYLYIVDAIIIILENKEKCICSEDIIYSKIASKYYTTPARVEKAIHHAVEISWEGLGKNNLKSWFPEKTDGPENGIFLGFMCKWINGETEGTPEANVQSV